MPQGERRTWAPTERVDRWTGLKVIQTTDFPGTTLHLHYETPTFTPDARSMIVVTNRAPGVLDAWRIGLDDKEMMKLCDEYPEGIGSVCLTTDGKHCLYVVGHECHRVSMEDGSGEVLGSVPEATATPYYRGMRSYDGKYYFARMAVRSGFGLVRWDLRTGEHVIVLEADGINHPTANPGGPHIGAGIWRGSQKTATTKRKFIVHCETLEELQLERPVVCAHSFWLGKSNLYQGTRQWPDHGVVVFDPDSSDFEVVADGPYFWHSGAAANGEWIVADTNFPDKGIWLINVAQRSKTLLCYGMSTQGHAQPTHPHPNLSDDAEYAVFTSDATGVTQPYIVPIPQDLRDMLSGIAEE